MTIAWREELSIDHGVIDEDHRNLVAIINEFEHHVMEGSKEGNQIDFDRLHKILVELHQYTEGHFQREEEIQIRILYPYHDAHKHEHADLVAHFKQMVQRFQSLHKGPEAARFVRDMAEFLKGWLINHIIHSDRRMKPYIDRVKPYIRDKH